MPGPESIDPSLGRPRNLLVGKKGGPPDPRAESVPGQDRPGRPGAAGAGGVARTRFSRALAAELGNATEAEAAAFSRASGSAPRSGIRLVRAYVPGDNTRRTVEEAVREYLRQDPDPAPPKAGQRRPLGWKEQIARYKEDQLLANPGGDHYYTDRATNVIVEPGGPSGFIRRVGKDLKDAGRNFLNMVENFFTGAEYKYRAGDGTIRSGRHRGLLGTVGRFFRNLASGLSFGGYVPEGEAAPAGLRGRTRHFFRKVFGEALLNNLVAGVPRAVGRMLKDGMLGVLNLAEVVADATIGSLPQGERLVTKTFDNAQVILSYAMDILPYGDAWSRVLSPGSADEGPAVPLLYNLGSPATGIRDSNWVRVRNTPFRKLIETAGSVVTSALSFFIPNLAFPKPPGTGEKTPPARAPQPSVAVAESQPPAAPEAPKPRVDSVYAEQVAAVRRVAAPESPEPPI